MNLRYIVLKALRPLRNVLSLAFSSNGRVRIAWYACGWGLCYSAYRAYYAVGGTFALPGRVIDQGVFQEINAIGAGILLLGAVLPVATLSLWDRPVFRPLLIAMCWIVAVGCVMHGLIDGSERILSLTGHLDIAYPSGIWVADRPGADIQDLLLNEPWFLVEGVLFGTLAYGALGVRARGRWVVSSVLAIAVLVCFGLLAAFGVTGRFIIG